jgi:hypothetical protein
MSETPTMTETFALSGAGNLFKQEDFDFCAQMEAKLAAMTARAELAERQVALLADFVQAFLDTVDEPPDPNCSCHINPPCADCVDNSGLRDLFVQARKIRAEAMKGGKG